MKCLNLHCHSVDVSEINTNGNITKLLNLQSQYESTFIYYYSKKVYSIECRHCNLFNDDYRSNFYISVDDFDYPEQKEVSLFCTKFGKLKYNFKKNINCFTFPEFSNYLLIGTKDEIISYICEEYNSLENDYNDLEKRIKNLDSANEIKEKSIKQMEKDLKKEKSEKEKIKNNLDNIEKEKNSLENNLQKEKSLTYKLNSKMEQLKKEKNNLKNEIQD